MHKSLSETLVNYYKDLSSHVWLVSSESNCLTGNKLISLGIR